MGQDETDDVGDATSAAHAELRTACTVVTTGVDLLLTTTRHDRSETRALIGAVDRAAVRLSEAVRALDRVKDAQPTSHAERKRGDNHQGGRR